MALFGTLWRTLAAVLDEMTPPRTGEALGPQNNVVAALDGSLFGDEEHRIFRHVANHGVKRASKRGQFRFLEPPTA